MGGVINFLCGGVMDLFWNNLTLILGLELVTHCSNINPFIHYITFIVKFTNNFSGSTRNNCVISLFIY